MAVRTCPSGEVRFLTKRVRADSFATLRPKLDEIAVNLEGACLREANHRALKTTSLSVVRVVA